MSRRAIRRLTPPRLRDWRRGPCAATALIVALDPPDGLLIDVTGAAHLHGGEAALLRDLLSRLQAAVIAARAGLADTVGAAHALARFAPDPLTIVAPGQTGAALASLPIAALRLDMECVDRLHRLGFETIADLMAVPRAPLALRFGPEPGRRLDQALGCLAEPIAPFRPPELIHVRNAFAEPIGAPETLARWIAHLTGRLCPMLERRGLGARRLDLLFERIDGRVEAIRIGTARPVRNPQHLARLLTDRLETVDPGFGIEAMILIASLAEPLMYSQGNPLGEAARAGFVGAGRSAREPSRCPTALSGYPGRERSARALGQERARRSPRRPVAIWPEHWPRPSRLLSPPEPVETVALLPDHAPAQFTWRGVCRRVIRADGPERVFGEWWRHDGEADAVRDYFIVED